MSSLTLGGMVSSFYNQIYCISSLILLITHAAEGSFQKRGLGCPNPTQLGLPCGKAKEYPW